MRLLSGGTTKLRLSVTTTDVKKQVGGLHFQLNKNFCLWTHSHCVMCIVVNAVSSTGCSNRCQTSELSFWSFCSQTFGSLKLEFVSVLVGKFFIKMVPSECCKRVQGIFTSFAAFFISTQSSFSFYWVGPVSAAHCFLPDCNIFHRCCCSFGQGVIIIIINGQPDVSGTTHVHLLKLKILSNCVKIFESANIGDLAPENAFLSTCAFLQFFSCTSC